MTRETALLGIYFVGLGSALCVWGLSRWRAARRASRLRAIEAGECVCSAHFAECICEIGGVHNPRGAGRGRMPRYITPPDIKRCRNLRLFGPTPCHYPACACFPPADTDNVQ